MTPTIRRASMHLRAAGMAVAIGVASIGCGTPAASTVPLPVAGQAATQAPRPTPMKPSAPRPSAPATSPTVLAIARLQARVAADPTDAEGQRDLGFAFAQRVRETADPSLYAPAMAAFEAAMRLDPEDALALAGIAGLELGKHEFAAGLVTARKAVALSPSLVAAHAAIVDALVELGRYDEADDAAGVMFGLRSDLSTLSRISYLAELRGHLVAALAAMRMAAESPGLAPENTAYVDALLGNLLVYSGDPASAAESYAAALALVPDHAPSLAGQGRLAVAAGTLDDAIGHFQRAAGILPLPEYVIALGDAQAAAGRAGDAQKSYDLARAEVQLYRAAGVTVDLDLALLEADHGDPEAALSHAKAGYAATPTVRAADAVAWALHRLGRDRDALTHSQEALRLGSIDPLLRYHAGAIEAALGDTAAAHRDLALALATDAGFSATGAAEARRLLDALPG